MRRQVIPEMLDKDLGTSAEVAASLADLRNINRWFGGVGTTVALLQQVRGESGAGRLSLLEVGSGAGHAPWSAKARLTRLGLEVQVTLLDRMESHLPRAGAFAVCGDALRLPFRDNTFDVVGCSLLAHHFEPKELRSFTGEALRVCRRAVLINDLIRSRLHLWLVYAGLPLFRSRITWHDAPASVRRAYTVGEIRSMLEGLPAARIEITRHYLFRMGVLVWKSST